MRTRRDEQPAWLMKDGSEIRELMHPSRHGVRWQSLAEATVPPGGRTRLHRHRATEEVYHVVSGSGSMTLGPEWLPLLPGDTVPNRPAPAEPGDPPVWARVSWLDWRAGLARAGADLYRAAAGAALPRLAASTPRLRPAGLPILSSASPGRLLEPCPPFPQVFRMMRAGGRG